MILDEKFSEILAEGEKLVEILRAKKVELEEIKLKNDALVDILCLYDNRNIITETLNDYKKYEKPLPLSINNELLIENLGRIDNPELQMKRSVIYPNGFVSKRCFITPGELKPKIYRCEIIFNKDKCITTITTEQNVIFRGREGFLELQKIIRAYMFASIEEFFGLSNPKIINIVYNLYVKSFYQKK